jgi:hypothetical protein
MALARWADTEYGSNDNYNFKELVLEKIRNEDISLNKNPDKPINIHNDNIVGIIIDEIIEKLQK